MCLCRHRPDNLPPCSQAALWAGCSLKAAGNCAVVRWLLLLLCIGVVLVLAGCKAVPVPSRPSLPPVDTAPVIAGQEGKDRAILSEAAQIDAIAPQAKPHTDAQRKAIEDNPAADVARIVAEFQARDKLRDAADKETAAIIAGLRKEIEDLQNQALREQARWLTWSGVALLAAFGVSLLFGQLAAAVKTWPLALLGVGCFGLAQLISHPWFLRSFIGLLIAALAYAAYYVYDRHKEGRLKRSLEKKADVLKQIVPVMDSAYESAEASVKDALDAKIFDRLSSIFSNEQKATVHALRAEVKSTS
jgi:hypothetical protein